MQNYYFTPLKNNENGENFWMTMTKRHMKLGGYDETKSN